MAYFSNGTEGDVLTEQCHNCLHGLDDEIMCPVAQLQLEYNYEQLDEGNEDLRTAMNLLISPLGECQMRAAMEKAGIKIDQSGRDQLALNIEGA